jgi:hypothetical protein
MARTSLFATALGLSMSLVAMASLTPAAATPLLSGGGDNMTITYGPNRGNTIVGGADAAVHGGGENKVYTARPGGKAREGRIGVLEGGHRDQAVRYQDRWPHSWAHTPADIDDLGHRG